jgi:hypothetical protein
MVDGPLLRFMQKDFSFIGHHEQIAGISSTIKRDGEILKNSIKLGLPIY